jgi:nucleotide-binding universal stress UspA family protein
MTAKPIVVGTDGSEESMRAVEWAAREAVLHGAPLRIVSVAMMPPRMVALEPSPAPDTVADLIRSKRDQTLAAAVQRAAEFAPGLLIDTVPLQDRPAQAVTESGSCASMLVLGSRGIGAFAALLLGSVSRYAAAHSSCPVVVVREESEALHRLVGVGVRDLDDCADSLAFAFEEAALRKANLIAVHAWHMPQADISRAGQAFTAPDPHRIEEQAAQALDRLLDSWREKYPDVQVSLDVVPGHPGRALVGLSARADLVVIGRHAKHPRLQGPGAVRHAVLNHAHGTVVIVPAA